MAILGREGIHKWTAADGTEFEMNRIRDDSGDPVRPYVKLRRAGLASLGDAQDNRDPLVGADGEVPRLSRRRGKTVPYEGVIRATSIRELREYQSTIRQAFSDRNSEGRMDVFPHPLATDLDGMDRYFNARVIGLEMEDVRDTQRFESTFVLGLRMSDPRYFEELTLATFKQAIIDLGPSLYWALDSIDGVDDLSGNGRNGTASGVTPGSGASLLPPGISGDDSTTFTDNNDRVTSDYQAWANATQRTILLFASRASSVGQMAIVGGVNATAGASIQLENGVPADVSLMMNSLFAATWTDAWPGNSTPTFLALSYDLSAGDAAIQIDDGESLAPDAPLSGSFPAADDFEVGLTGLADEFDGDIAHVAVFERVLSPQQIAQIYEWATTGLRSYW